MLTVARSILHRTGGRLPVVWWARRSRAHRDGPAVVIFGDDDRSVVLPENDWRDMGEPESVTVTIEPGDRLN
jgi:hypothetical protein